MSDFATSAALDVTVSPDSLRKARGTIEDELGGVEVEVGVSTTGSRSGGGGRMAGRERAMGRQLDTTRNDHLAGIDGHWTENLDLNRERNDLLRQLADITEKDAQTARSAGGGGLSGGVLGLAIGGVGLGSMLLSGLGSSISDAIGKLDPRDWNIPSPVPDDWEMPSPVPTDWQIPDLVPDDWKMPSPVPDNWSMPSPVPDNWNMPSPVPDDWNMPSPVPESWNMPSPVPDDWEIPSPVPDDWGIPDITIDKPDWIPIPTGSPVGTGSPSGDGSPSGNGGGLGPWIAGAAAGAYAAGQQFVKFGGKAAGPKAASATTPAMDAAALPDEMFPDGENPWKDQSMLERFRGAYGIFPGGNLNNPPEKRPADDPNQWKTSPTNVRPSPGTIDLDNYDIETQSQSDSGGGGSNGGDSGGTSIFNQMLAEAYRQGAKAKQQQATSSSQESGTDQSGRNVTAEQTNSFEINADTSDLEREVQKRFKEVEEELEKLSRALNP
ncbi:hypothetical protein [Natrinema soli]|uniref:Uncharacterized protein n=1 Tax=Natrinema soli TaxID=1930624 RepID=A0ABD5SPP1_9EURY|nr:hypothetical protein [Natrinema soli]